MNTLKQKIKELSVKQVELKNQRKTVNLVGERTVAPYQAAYQHSDNRLELRRLFIAYGLLRGKTIEQIEPTTKNPIYAPGLYSKDVIDKMVAQYKQELEIA